MATSAMAEKAWLSWGRWVKRWHGYEVEGDSNLSTTKTQVLVAYSGRGFAFDVIALNQWIHKERDHLPLNIFSKCASQVGPMGWLQEGIGGVVGYDQAAIDSAVSEKRHIIATPGGSNEAARGWSRNTRYKVDFGSNVDYINIAHKNSLEILPVTCSGTDDVLLGLNNGNNWGSALGLPDGFPLWLGLGPLGLSPFTPTFPVKLKQKIGAPYSLVIANGDPLPANPTQDQVNEAHQAFQAHLQAQLDAQNPA